MARVVVTMAALVGTLAVAPPSEAAFPGVNGRIAYASVIDVYTIDPSGLTRLQITDDCCYSGPVFSPDGARIAFVSTGAVHTTDQYGADQRIFFDAPGIVREVAWSPDGTKLVASIADCLAAECPSDLFVFGPLGSGLTNITNTLASENYPKWSPDGSKIAFDSFRGGEHDIYVVAPDGTGEVNLTATNPQPAVRPDWSPDGSKLSFISDERLFTMNADGTGAAPTGVEARFAAWSPDGTQLVYRDIGTISRIPAGGGMPAIIRYDGDFDPPDWQPLPEPPTPPATGSGYPRPRGANLVRVPLVVGYRECRGGNRQHAPPLSHPSCSPPAAISGPLQLGTPDFNGHPANGIGSFRVAPIVGDPTTAEDEADVRITVSQTDVWILKNGVLVNYAGKLRAAFDLRITDKFSAGGPDASATMMDVPLWFMVQCAATPDDPAGGTCALTTTADALAPGTIPEGRRTIWQLDEPQLRFAGNGQGPLESDQIVLRAGVFVP